MKTKTLLHILVISLLLFASCNKDEDDSEGCANEISYPYTSQYSGAEEVEFRIWTNGEEISTVGLDPADFLSPQSFEIFYNIDSFDVDLTFTADSLTIAPDDTSPRTFGYQFVNGVLLITELDIYGVPFTYPLGYGTIDNFEVRNGLFSFCKMSDEPLLSSYANRVSDFYYYNLDSVSSELEVDDVLLELDENDTLTIYNFRYLFN